MKTTFLKELKKFLFQFIIALIFLILFEYLGLSDFLQGWFGCLIFMTVGQIVDKYREYKNKTTNEGSEK